MKPRRCPAVVALVAAAGVVVAAAGLALVLATRDAGTSKAAASRDAGSSRDGTIPAAELASLPPIALIWADRDDRLGAGDLYVVGADGTGLRRVKAWPRRLANGRAYGADGVAWSPDRTRLAVETWAWIADPVSQMAVVAADGPGLRMLEGWDWGSRSFDWSPTGEALLFSRFHELFVFRPATGRTVRIWRSKRGDTFQGVDWASSGRELAASADRGIAKMTPAGAGLRWLTGPPPAATGLSPQWSPDGSTIVFTWGEVHTVGRDGEYLQVLNANARGVRPLWSPNGRSIAFTRTARHGGPRDVLVMRSDGRRLRTLTTGAAADALDWSPDGSKILFLREARDPQRRAKTWWELWVMDADGGRHTRLPFNRAGWSVLAADWRS